MRTATWGNRQGDVLKYSHLVDWVNGKDRYKDLPALGLIGREIASLRRKPILGDLRPMEEAYVRAHWERRNFLRKTMDFMGRSIWESEEYHVGDHGELITEEPRSREPDWQDPVLMERLRDYWASARFDADYRHRVLGRTGTWAGPNDELYLVAPVQPFVYARAGAIALRFEFGLEQRFKGNAAWNLLRTVGLDPPEATGVQNLLRHHGVVRYVQSEFDTGPPNPVSTPMELVPEAIDYLIDQDYYTVPLEVAPQ